ncbi:MAG TPA: allophanate hydrolase [Steroidobacteraceae bacterium]|nr:allophanate hydrolase [Steroidobacteraceae bacterium]
MPDQDSLLISDLRRGYLNGSLTPARVLARLIAYGDRTDSHNVWITRFPLDQVMGYVHALQGRSASELPLYGIPFVIKDNIDLQGVPTTAGCPDFAYTPQHTAPVVQRLLDAGAIPLGKTNLDQFATGLVGVRSPYGACRNSIDPAYIPGGSSSGSAVAVAAGLASFSLGTDTAGSGRVPAAFNNIVGLKPSVGRLSTRGVVPACRSLDCVSIFALTAEDAGSVLDAAQGYDALDPYSSKMTDAPIPSRRFGVPRPEQLQFFGDAEYARLFEAAARRLEHLGATRIEIDFSPFLDAARLLYEGPWVAERYAAVGAFMEKNPAALFPVTAQIIAGGRKPSAVDAFQGEYRLKTLRRASESGAWGEVDLILTPTAGTIYTIAAVDADPIRLNSTLGYYTNFMNFFQLAGVAVPAGFRTDGLPFGITLVGRHGTDRALLALAARLQRSCVSTLGALHVPMPPPAAHARELDQATGLEPGYVAIAVCGAHMSGLPLNHQLRDRGGYLLRTTRTAPCYRLFALPGGPPSRPGLVRVANGGAAVEVEVWALPGASLGSFLAVIPAPLGMGTLELEPGTATLGFLCEAYAAEGAADVTAYGGWRAYLARVDAGKDNVTSWGIP